MEAWEVVRAQEMQRDLSEVLGYELKLKAQNVTERPECGFSV